MTRKTIDSAQPKPLVVVQAERGEQVVPAQQHPRDGDVQEVEHSITPRPPVGLRRDSVASEPVSAGSTRGGTGSCPPAWNGWQRSSRRSASQPPRPAPCTLDRLERVRAAASGCSGRPAAKRADRGAVEADAAPAARAAARGRDRRAVTGDRSATRSSRPASAASARSRSAPSSAEVALGRRRQGADDGAAARGQRVEPRRTAGRAAAGSPGAAPRCRRRPCSTTKPDDAAAGRRRQVDGAGARRPARRGARRTAAHDRGEVGRAAHPVRRRAARRGRAGRAGRRSGRQLAAALAAAGGDDGAAGAGAHAQPEAVRLGPAAVVRLEGALAHGRTPSVGIDTYDARGHAGVTCNGRRRSCADDRLTRRHRRRTNAINGTDRRCRRSNRRQADEPADAYEPA